MKNGVIPSSIADVSSLLKAPFLKNVSLLVSGKVAAQAIIALATPVLTRLYDPTMFGFLGLFSSIAAIGVVVTTFKYDMAIVLPKEDEDASSLAILSGALAIITSLISLLIISIFHSQIASLLDSPGFVPFLFLLPLMFFLKGANQIFQSWGTRRKWFKMLSITAVVTALSSVVLKIIWGLIEASGYGLILSLIIGQFAGTVWLAWNIWQIDGKTIFYKIKKEIVKNNANKYSNFPKFAAPQNLINSVSQQIPPLLFAGFFGPAVVGWYYLATRLLKTPSNLIGESLKRVFYQRASEKFNNEENLYDILLKATLMLLAVAFIPMVVIIIFGPPIFGFVLGSEWTEAGRYSQWLAIWLFISLINRPSVALINVLGLQKLHLYFDIVVIFVRVAAILIGGYLGSAILAVAIYGVTSAIFNLLLIVYMLVYTKNISAQALGK